MGWKNVKEHYGIGHIVQVCDGMICIGSGYVPEIIIIDANLNIKRNESIGRGEPFDGWVSEMESDLATLRRLIETPDTFARDLPVYTYDYDGNIIQHMCEEYGWPNVTHSGALMYENTFSESRDEIVKTAKATLSSARDNAARTLANVEKDLKKWRRFMNGYQAALAKLEGETPST